MTTPNPRGFPRKSVFEQLAMFKRVIQPHWSFDQKLHERSKRRNEKEARLNNKLDALGI